MTDTDLRKQDEQDVRAIFQTREGARFFARLIHECGVYQENYADAPQLMALLEGKRVIGLTVLQWLCDADENAVAKLFQADKERVITEWEKTDRRA